MLEENILSLPSIRHMHSLSKSVCMDIGLTGNTNSFVVARIKQISERERHVVFLIDEIYTAQREENQSEKLYGYESQQTTKTTETLSASLRLLISHWDSCTI